jgi:pimeloyl-ACP methyl ester carboxylesterase
MDRLGYRTYGVQGGDWGSGVARALGALAPSQVLGVHLNYLPTPGDPTGLSAADRARAEKTTAYAANRPAYHALHSTRPQTVAYALADSPVGQLAWLAEGLTRWADPAAPLPDETILADVSLYWFTGTAASSSRLAKESPLGPTPCPVPMAVAVLPHDLVQSVRPLAERRYDIRQWTEFPRGGHFAGWEAPDLLAADVAAFFGGGITARAR